MRVTKLGTAGAATLLVLLVGRDTLGGLVSGERYRAQACV